MRPRYKSLLDPQGLLQVEQAGQTRSKTLRCTHTQAGDFHESSSVKVFEKPAFLALPILEAQLHRLQTLLYDEQDFLSQRRLHWKRWVYNRTTTTDRMHDNVNSLAAITKQC